MEGKQLSLLVKQCMTCEQKFESYNGRVVHTAVVVTGCTERWMSLWTWLKCTRISKKRRRVRMADSRLDIVLKQIDKKYGKGTVIRGSQYPDLPRFSSGIFSLDVEIGGGIPRGRILIMTGNESTGKTTVARRS